jgi:hypothetical protein
VVFHFGAINLFSEPERAILELFRVAREGGVVAWGDEGFRPERLHGIKERILTRLNPGYAKAQVPAPAEQESKELHWVFEGNAYLIVCRKISSSIPF